MGYFIAEKYWDKGIMTEAVTQICEYVFPSEKISPPAHANLRLLTFYCQTFEKNAF